MCDADKYCVVDECCDVIVAVEVTNDPANVPLEVSDKKSGKCDGVAPRAVLRDEAIRSCVRPLTEAEEGADDENDGVEGANKPRPVLGSLPVREPPHGGLQPTGDA